MRLVIQLVLVLAGYALGQDTAKRIAPVSSSDATFFEKHGRVALVVGVQDYDEDTGLSKLNFSGTADVAGVAQALRAQEWHVITLANKEAKRHVILSKLAELSSHVKKDGGTFLFFFSGHGGTGADGLNYLAVWDTPAALLQEEGLSIAKIEDTLRRSGAQRQVMLIDACRNVPIPTGTKKAGTLTPRFAEIQSSRGMEVLYSTAPNAFSYEGPNGYSTFTEFFLKGLQGAAAGPDGLVTMDDLRRYVEREVSAAEEARGHVQRPYHRFDSTGEIVLARVAVRAPVESAFDLDFERFAAVKESRDPDQLESVAGKLRRADLAEILRDRARAMRSALPGNPGASKPGVDVEAWTKIADQQYAAKDYSAAYASYSRLAVLGNSHALFRIGRMYHHGEGMNKNYTEAVNWYHKAVDAGDAQAMNNLGTMYQFGHGVAQDDKEAVKWYRKAADAGNPVAMSNLGAMYRDGEGVTQDYQEALKWYRKSSRWGEEAGMANLGSMYEDGNGITKDISQAISWYRKAAAAGFEKAKENLERLRKAGFKTDP